jgi:hypothetical protein
MRTFINAFTVLSFLLLLNATSLKMPASVDEAGLVKKAKTDLLTESSWRFDEVMHVIDGVFTKYKRGESNNTGVAYKNFIVTFSKDGTGTHVAADGIKYPAKWKFKDKSENEIVYTVYFGNSSVTNVWEMFDVNAEYLYGTAHLSNTHGNDDVESFRMISTKFLNKQLHI